MSCSGGGRSSSAVRADGNASVTDASSGMDGAVPDCGGTSGVVRAMFGSGSTGRPASFGRSFPEPRLGAGRHRQSLRDDVGRRWYGVGARLRSTWSGRRSRDLLRHFSAGALDAVALVRPTELLAGLGQQALQQLTAGSLLVLGWPQLFARALPELAADFAPLGVDANHDEDAEVVPGAAAEARFKMDGDPLAGLELGSGA